MEQDKNPAEEDDKNRAAQLGIDPGAEKSCSDSKSQESIHPEAPTSEGGSTMINKEHIMLSTADKTQVPDDVEEPNMLGVAEQTHLLVVQEEQNATKKPQMKKKEEKRKRRKLQEIKKEQQLGGAEKSQDPINMDDLAREGGSAMIKEKKRKRRELQEIKKEQQLGGAEKSQEPINMDEPAREGGSAMIKEKKSSK